MNSSESVSFSMDTTTDSIDVIASTSIYVPGEHLDDDNDDRTKLPPDKSILTRALSPETQTTSSTPSMSSTSSNSSSSTSSSEFSPSSALLSLAQVPSCDSDNMSPNQSQRSEREKKSVIFDTVTVFHFNRSQGFSSIPSQGGSTLGMKRRHFLRRRLSVDLYEEVRRRSRREILLKIKLDKKKRERELQQLLQDQEEEVAPTQHNINCDDERIHCSSNTSSTSSSSNTNTSDSDDGSFSDISDISDSELDGDGYIFLQPIGVKLRRSLLKASGVGRIDPREKKDCRVIRDSRERSGCRCVDQCLPEFCECSRLGVNCHVDRISFPCGCISSGCQNPEGRTEFDISRVRGHFQEKIIKSRIDQACLKQSDAAVSQSPLLRSQDSTS